MFTQSRIVVLVLMSLFVLTSPLVYAADAEQPASKEATFKQKAQERMQQLYKELNVTDEQRMQLEANKTKNMQEVKTLMQSMREKREFMRAEFQKEELNEAAVKKINAEIKQLQDRMSDLRLEGMLLIRRILTPEQFKKFSEKMDKGRGQGMHRGDKRGERTGQKEGCSVGKAGGRGPGGNDEGFGGPPPQE